jgi:phosphatidylglycerophosphate synthase/putative flippase GtrA
VPWAEALRDAALPVVVVAAYFLGGLALYVVRIARRGAYHDDEIATRGQSVVIGMAPRHFFAWVMRPLWVGLVRLDFPPDAITILSVLIASASGLALAAGQLTLGGWLYLTAGACDFVDGRLARASGRASPAGAAMDSVLDRYAESAVFLGLAWYYGDSWVSFAAMMALVGSHLVPYVRARGEGLGVDVKMGTMQRPERLVIMGGAAVLSPIFEPWLAAPGRPPQLVVVGALLLLAVSTHITAIQRLRHVVQALRGPGSATTTVAPQLGRSVVSAVLATGADFVVVLTTLDLGLTPWLATGLGCVVGGVLNFGLNRLWTFASRGAPAGEALRYAVVSGSSALLNAGGVAAVLLLPGIPSLVAWGIVRGVVFLSWNYPLQRSYVFEARTR